MTERVRAVIVSGVVLSLLGRDSLLVRAPGLVIERLRVRIPAAAAGEFSSPELTLCVDSYLVSAPPSRYRGGT